MKILLSTLLACTIFSISQAQIINSSFENWQSYSTGEFPVGWMTSDSVSVALGEGNNATKGIDPYDGAFSIHLRSVVTSFGISGPGVATNGIITLVGANFVFSGGSPDTARSRVLTGYYKYTPMNPNDSGVVKTYLLKYNSGTGNRDTIASGETFIGGTVSTYTPFTVWLSYFDYANQPDTTLIIIQSSKGVGDPNLAENTELVVDSLNFSGFVGINEIGNVVSSVNVYPTPADNMLSVDVTTKSAVKLRLLIFDTRGKMVMSKDMNSDSEKVDVSSLSEGNYVIKISDRNNSNLYSKNFSVIR